MLMHPLHKMIQKLCPNGVKWVKLGEVCDFKRGTVITAKNTTPGNVPVIAGGLTPAYYHNKSTHQGETITVAGSGVYAGTVLFWDIPIWVSDAFCVETSNILNKKYVFYFLKQIQQDIYRRQKGAGIPHVHGSDLSNFDIPLPPLPIQEEIVKTLDTFSALLDNIDEEIAQREKQYEYYREKLLTFKEGECEWKKLGEVCETFSGFPFDSSKFTKSGIKLMRGVNVKRGVFDFNEQDDRYWDSIDGLENYLLYEKDIIISMDGSLVGKSFAFINEMSEKMLLVQRVAAVRSSQQNIRFIFYNITHRFPKYVESIKTQGAIPHISMKNINNFPIPLPSPSRQAEIVKTLDAFEAIINNLKAEREQRQKQYEYYREALLNFKNDRAI